MSQETQDHSFYTWCLNLLPNATAFVLVVYFGDVVTQVFSVYVVIISGWAHQV